MRIAIVAPEQIPVPPILGGSVEITILAVAAKLAELRHSVTVISRSHPRYPNHSVVSGVHIHRVQAGSPSNYLARVRRFLAGKEFDVIQIDNRPRFVRAIKQMFPTALVSLFLHSLTFVSPPYADRAAAEAGLRAADIIIANSSSLKSRLGIRFPGVAHKIRKVWLGVDTARFSPADEGKSGRSFTLLFAGRLIPRKGLPVLLQAVKHAQDRVSKPLKVIVAGGSRNGGYVLRMRTLARQKGVSADFLGTVPHSRIHRVFRKADVFVCPSQEHEAFGLVNVEALSSGLPVIASDIGGIGEIVIHNRNGILIRDYRNPRSFAEAIVRVANDSAFLRVLKLQARQDCLNRFNWSATAIRLIRLYESPDSPGES
ncbi:glycosyltransferase [Cohnella sp. CFH 77786]|uniref:glycosyltransferase family 4 protein n=1 Tax=Cohnella sp. CFH 77786 TaxID=2662265 RepID=UPI001C60E0A5|nr:glycosyltransferase family 4 protein [Cohnella sp. CFH 77786]MBW5446302.1 glycosyltransferase [Cohnella sp. CFH 77786]